MRRKISANQIAFSESSRRKLRLYAAMIYFKFHTY